MFYNPYTIKAFKIMMLLFKFKKFKIEWNKWG